MTTRVTRLALPLLLALALLASGVTGALAAPGDLDTGFGNGGRLIVDLGGEDFILDVLVQPDAKIVTVGPGGIPTGFRIMRLNPDGSSDTGFGNGGTAAPDFTELEEIPVSASLAPGGKIVLVGTARNEGSSSIIVVRLLANGQPDPDFDGEGLAIVDVGQPAGGREVAVAADGSVVVAGERVGVGGVIGPGGMVLARLTSAGAPDPAFNNGAPLVFDPDPGELVIFRRAMALLPNGGIMLAFSVSGESDRDVGLARLTPSGAVDPEFAAGGAFRGYDFGGDEDPVRMALQPDGKVVVAGSAGPGRLSAIMRFTSDGGLDESFGTNGRVGVDLGGLPLDGVAVQANGKLVGFGDSDAGNAIAMRVQPGGALDTTFAGGGLMLDAFGGGDDGANAGALQRNGAVLVAGGSAFNQALARLQGDGPAGGPAPSPGDFGGPGGGGPGGGSGGGVPRCAGKKATIVGSARSDRLKGTRRADVIVALGGNDRIASAGGNDRICAGNGNDRIDGGTGNDRLYGQNGKDTLAGGNGTDALNGGTGNDKLGGGAGKDNLTGGAGKDNLSGGSGRDKCAGNAGRDNANCERGRA